MSEYAPVARAQCLPHQKEAADKALALNERLPDVHEALAEYYMAEWQWPDWEREHRRALELDPNSANAHHWFGLELTWLGRYDEGLTHLRRAVELDPLNLKFNDNLGQGLMNARRDDEALAQLKKTTEMDPNFAGTYGDLSTLYRYQGKYQDWLDALKKNATLNDLRADLTQAEELQRVFQQSGYKAAVIKDIELSKNRSVREYVDPGIIAEEYAFLGDKDRAFEWLEKAYQQKSEEMADLRVRRALDFLRSDPRYKDLERRAGYTW